MCLLERKYNYVKIIRMNELVFNSPQETLERYKAGEINEDEALAVIRAFPTKITIPRQCFENQTHYEQISTESDEKYQMEVPTIDNFKGQIYVGVVGAEFPIKTFVDPEMLSAANIAKSIFIEPIKLLSMPQFWPSVAYTALSRKSLNKVIQGFNRTAGRAMSPWILKDEHCTTFTPQFCFFIFTFLHKLGVREDFALDFATIISRLVEYDNAYRLRLEDIFSETKKENWNKPRKELRRLAKIFGKRDINWNVTKKVNQLVDLLCISLYIPKVKKALIYAINQVELKDLQLDDQDKYFTLLRRDYNAMGMTYEERQEYGRSRGWKFPNQLPIN